jgi:hypothetical protein
VAQPTVRAVGTVSSVASGNMTPGVPTGTTTNDIMVCFTVAADNVVVTYPVGWTKFIEQNNGTTQRMTAAWKLAGAAETAPTVTHAAGGGAQSRIISFIGANTTAPIGTLGTPSVNASSTTVTASTITPSAATELCVWFGVSTQTGTSNQNAFAPVGGTNPTFTERIDNAGSAGANEADMAVDTGPFTSVAATGARTSTLSLNATVNIGVMFTLTDVGGAAPTRAPRARRVAAQPQPPRSAVFA